MSDDKKIECKICGARVHSISIHIDRDHKGSDWTLNSYMSKFPGEPVVSQMMMDEVNKQRAKKAQAESEIMAMSTNVSPIMKNANGNTKQPLHELFGLGDAPAAKTPRGTTIMIDVLGNHEFQDMVPEPDDTHIWNIEDLKNILMALTINIPVYLVGHTGTGKTTSLLNIFSKTNRPVIRIQHTVNTEESHIVGQWTVRGGETKFELGPLAQAMKYGWVYLADEYDFGMPNVLSVYQAVLEGKPLVIKEADSDNRIIKPHPNFRFVANGNTNGNGDESGLYQGVSIQNAANYDRFGMVIEVKYMSPELESQMLVKKVPSLKKKDADDFVEFATMIRESFSANKMASTISPRTLINAATIGMARGNWALGLTLCFTNKLSRVDKVAAEEIIQRLFKIAV